MAPVMHQHEHADGPGACRGRSGRTARGPGSSWRGSLGGASGAAGGQRSAVIRTARARSRPCAGRPGCRRARAVGPLSTMPPGLPCSARKNAACWDTRAACCMLWVTMTIVTCGASSAIVSSIRRVEVGSRAEHGSSMSSTLGPTARARAMHSRCCCPPESADPGGRAGPSPRSTARPGSGRPPPARRGRRG